MQIALQGIFYIYQIDLLLHHFVELVESDFLLVESYGVLECSSKLHVDSTLYEVVYSLALLEELVSVVLDVLLRMLVMPY